MVQNRTPSLTQTIVGITSLICLLIFASNIYTTVGAGHNKIATLFGEVQSEPYSEGFHLVNPLLSFITFDLRQQTITWREIQVPSQDKLKTSMDVSVTFRIDGSQTPRIYQETGDLSDVVKKHITPKVRSLLREAGKSVSQSQDFYLEEIQKNLQDYMLEGLKSYLEPKGVVVEAVLFRDITLPQVVTSAVIQTKERQEQLEREKAQLKIVEQQAQQQVKQAEAREQAAIADANAKRTQADAEAYRILKEAEAQSEANVKLSESISESLIDYNRVKQWNGAYPATMLSSDTSVLFGVK
jgi:regulator of protease activity HflC (stomatin/prohibitin superfamily)